MTTETTIQELPFPGDTNENFSSFLEYPSFSQAQTILQQTCLQYSLNFRCRAIHRGDFTDETPVSNTATQTASLHFYNKNHIVKEHLPSVRGELLQKKVLKYRRN